DFSLGLYWKEIKKHPEDILNLAEKIAESNGKKWVICMDEFQNIADFHQPLAFQKRLRAAWQKQKHISYCLYGSKRHMMMEVFASPSMPFYKFGEILFLEKIKEEDWVKFITKRFADTRKKISVENAALIAQLMENHPYYVQQLAQQCWLRSNRTCNTNIVYQAHDSIAMQLSLLFQSLTDNLSNTQLNFLKAMLEGVEKFSSKDAIHTYRFGTSANVLRIRDALLNKEVIDRVADKYYFIDPVYKYWLKNYYFIG
ncbi:MAG: ATPase, partial [Bacteroidetes bacterium]|nr:ATPase [Bacteroidota bacterium]